MLTTVARGPESRARTGRAGRQAALKEAANCCANVRATSRRKVSPMTKPRTRPFGLRSAAMRLKRSAAAMTSGTSVSASLCAAWWSNCMSSSESRSRRKCSLVQPDGPGAAPRRARRKLLAKARRKLLTKAPHDSLTGSCGWCWRTAFGIGTRGLCGLRAGSRSSRSVSSLPGASSSAVSARAAAESSPKCANAAARPLPQASQAGPGRAGSGPSRGPRRLQQLGPLARPEQACSSLELSWGDPRLAMQPGQQHPGSQQEQLPSHSFSRCPRRVPDQPEAASERKSKQAARPAWHPLQRRRADAEGCSEVYVIEGMKTTLHRSVRQLDMIFFFPRAFSPSPWFVPPENPA